MNILEWWQFDFMQNALWAILMISPLFAMVGSLVVNARLSFFSDAIGHSALTGVAMGTLLGLQNPTLMIIAYSLLLSFLITLLKRRMPQKTDTSIALVMSFSVALGVVLLSRNGSFSKFTNLLIGDFLTLNNQDLLGILLLVVASFFFLLFFTKKIILVSLNSSLAKSRGINTFLVEVLFCSFVAIVVSLSISWVGLLVINSLLVLPAAASNNIARNMKSYFFFAIIISLIASVVGLILSYYLSSATGATIVLTQMLLFICTLFLKNENPSNIRKNFHR